MVTASQIVGRIVVEGDDTARAKLLSFSKAVDQTQSALGSKLVAATKAASPALAEVGAKASGLGGMLRNLEGDVTRTGKSFLTNMGSQLKAISVPAMAALGAALVGVGAAVVSAIPKATAFERTLKQIYSTNDITTKQVDALSDSLLKMSGKVGKGPQDLADALYYVMGAGYDSAHAMDILERSAKQAAVGMTDTETVANGATAVLKAFPALSTAQAFDMMTASVALGKTEWATYGPVIGKTALFAQQAGVSFQEATTALSTLTNVMPSTEQAATSLDALLQTSSHFSYLAKTAEGLGIAFDENAYKAMSFVDRLRYLRDITGGNAEAIGKLLGQEEALPAINGILINDAKDYANALGKITNSAGSADTAWTKSSEGLGLSWDKVTSTLESLQVKIGMGLIPLMKVFVENVAPVIANVVDWIDKNHVLENTISFVSTAIQNVQTFLQNGATVIQNISNAVGDFTGTGSALEPVLTALGGILVAILVPAIWSFASGVIAATWPVLLIGGAIAGLTALFLHFYNSNAGFRDFINGIGQVFTDLWTTISTNFLPVMGQIANIIQTQVWPALQNLGNFLLTTFKPVWDQLVATWQTQLMPALTQIWGALQNLMPVFQALGGVILVMTIAGFALLVGVIQGVVAAIAPVASGIIQIVGGIVQGFSGAIQILSGIVMAIVHLCTGQFGALGADLGMIWSGIISAVQGFGAVFSGIWQVLVGGVVALVSGFVSGVIGFFTNLWNVLVGHSIIPDMVNGIISWIGQLPGRAFSILAGLVSGAIGMFSGFASGAINQAMSLVSGFIGQVQLLPSKAASAISSLGSSIGGVIQGVIDSALDWGGNIVNNIASGITNAAGGVVDAISGVVDTISSFLPHSPAKRGALRTLPKQGFLISDQVAQGMLSGLPQIHAAIGDITAPIAGNLTIPPVTPSVVPASQLQRQSVVQPDITVQPAPIYLDGRMLAQALMPYIVDQIRAGSGIINY
jgi:TP901 family phage tail tape measure protein